ncbi:hypothetical protein [Rhodothermus bifroesti]|uniref:hypothetical protein n=1 Tax=Rhodothermus bifroesti TaxID=2823335 RepID=UPI001AEFD53D|nr:hypothetical protein [Rhodothermus bifroesti]
MGSGSPEIFSEITSPPDQNGKAAPSRLVSVFGWARKGFWAVLDQGLFAGSNFLASVLLARWLEPASYGAFSVAFSIFLLLGTLHTALWTEPMLVYGSGKFREAFLGYQRVLIGYHWRFGVFAGVAFALASAGSWAGGQREMALSLLGLAFAAPMVLYLWLVRRGAYALLEPRVAVYGGAFYLALYLGAAWVLLKVGLLNEATALLSMAAAAFLAAEVVRFRPRVGSTHPVEPGQVRSLHWNYSRWALLAGGLSWVPGNIYYLALPAFHGLEAAAQLKALMNLLMPILHFNGALAQRPSTWDGAGSGNGWSWALYQNQPGSFPGLYLGVLCTPIGIRRGFNALALWGEVPSSLGLASLA